MKTLLRLLLKSQHQRNRYGLAQTENGMTLVELLVGSIMAFLIITPMLSFVVDMLNTDRREQVKSNTEQDLQAAVDFIAQDLSQAIYIYDKNPTLNNTPNTTSTGIPAIRDKLPNPVGGTPILVFLKQQQMKNSLPINKEAAKTVTPKTCDDNPGQCNDTYVLSLVAYYQIQEKDKNSIWCQPSGDNCPTRIVRYEIRDGVRNPDPADFKEPYYKDSDTKLSQRKSPAFDQKFNPSKPTVGVATSSIEWGQPEVLVNYIDHSPGPILTPCTTVLGNPTDPKDTTKKIDGKTLTITDSEIPNPTNSFYACVDTEKNIARVTIRGNSLRRLQANNADFKTTSSAFFPTASVQVKGLGARGN